MCILYTVENHGDDDTGDQENDREHTEENDDVDGHNDFDYDESRQEPQVSRINSHETRDTAPKKSPCRNKGLLKMRQVF